MRIKSTNGDVTIAHQKWGWDLLEDICDYLSVPMTLTNNKHESHDCLKLTFARYDFTAPVN